MTETPVSVIIVSRGRPALLARCVLAVSQLYYHPFEIVVVADQAGLDALDLAGMPIKTACYNEANISQARNIGLSLAAGKIVAFIDDDAVPEPGWLHHLAAVFQNPLVMAAGGYVLGRNGISRQSGGQTISATGETRQISIDGTNPKIFDGNPDLAIKTEGTNCAFRRGVFTNAGGFDTNFHYYMDEADLNIRFARDGYKTAVVPLAIVHHDRAGSDFRTNSQMPKSLFEIGASTAIFLRKHNPQQQHGAHLDNAREAQRKILLRHMIAGNCEPRDIPRLLKTFDEGITASRNRPLAAAPTIDNPLSAFTSIRPAQTKPTHKVISGFRISSSRLQAKAKTAVRAGHIVSLYIFSRTALFHRTRFHADGYWLQTGGLFGRSLRSGKLFQATKLSIRTAKEDQRIARIRHPWALATAR